MRCEERFYEIYKKDPAGITFSPYRICPIGAHSDHNLGKITGFAIDKGIHIAYRPKQNGVVEMQSLQFEKRAQWHIKDVGEKTGDWADYLRGATWALNKEHPLSVGLCGVIEGSLPIGGLSSSAAVILAFLTALCKVNGIVLSSQELIGIAFDAEKIMSASTWEHSIRAARCSVKKIIFYILTAKITLMSSFPQILQ